MSSSSWTEADSVEAARIWAEYQSSHDVSGRRGQTVGVDPATGRVWFGHSAKDITAQREAAGERTPLYFVRVGFDYYQRKGARR
jgi:hypothetical protein